MNKIFAIWLMIGAVVMVRGYVTIEDYFICWASLLCSILYNRYDREERDYEQTTKTGA